MAETFGKTDKGLNQAVWSKNNQWICKFTSGSAGSLESISLWVKRYLADGNAKCAIFDASYNLLENGITEEKPFTTGQDAFITFNFTTSPEVAAATVYYLAWWINQDILGFYSAGSVDQILYDEKTYNSWDDPLDPTSYDTMEVSIYATYEEAPPNEAPTAPTSLQVDGKSVPTGANCISDPTPGFTAIYNDPDAGDTSNAIQIQVGTASGLSDMWDSGWLADATVTPNRCAAKTYAGAALSAGTSYWWRCRFRDDDNAIGAWSAWQQFDVCEEEVPIGIGLQCVPGGPLPHRRPFTCATRLPRKEPSYRFPYEYPLMPGIDC